MKVAVSGSSGFLGSSLVPALEAEGHEILRIVRRVPVSDDELEWDPASGAIDAPRLAGVDAFVNLSGATIAQRWTASHKREILESRVSSTSLLARTAANLDPRPSVFVCAGGVGIYGDGGDEILTEESELGTGFLADVGRAWAAAADPARDTGIRVVNMRQGLVLSRRGGALAQMLVPFKLGVGGRVGTGKQWWSWVALDDYVRAVRFLLDGDLEGPVNVVSPNPVTNSQFTKALGRALRRPTILPVPRFALRTRFGREMAQEALLAGQRALPGRLLAAGYEFEAPTIDVGLARALAT